MLIKRMLKKKVLAADVFDYEFHIILSQSCYNELVRVVERVEYPDRAQVNRISVKRFLELTEKSPGA